jgi:hypothetical protein
LERDEADEIARESAEGIDESASILWLNKLYGETHQNYRFWDHKWIVDDTYMEELTNFFDNLFPTDELGTIISCDVKSRIPKMKRVASPRSEESHPQEVKSRIPKK